MPCSGDCGSAPRFGYWAFGFFLSSNLPLPGLTQCANPGLPEIRLELDSQPVGFDRSRYQDVWYRSRFKNSAGESTLIIYTSGTDDLEFWLDYEDGTHVFVGEKASKIWVTWPAWSSLEDAATYLLGPVMAIIAQLRGTTCLHGSAVVVEDGIVAF